MTMSNEYVVYDKELVKMIKIFLANDITKIKYWKDSDKNQQRLFKSGSGLYSVPYVHYFCIVNE